MKVAAGMLETILAKEESASRLCVEAYGSALALSFGHKELHSCQEPKMDARLLLERVRRRVLKQRVSFGISWRLLLLPIPQIFYPLRVLITSDVNELNMLLFKKAIPE